MRATAILVLLFLSACCHLHAPIDALPLYTNSRWIVDDAGRRVKLACVNWPSHLETLLAEGLSKQPLDYISQRIVSMGFNCVRFTWALFMATNETLGSNTTVRQNLEGLGLKETIAGIQVNNPKLLDLPIIEAYQAVVSGIGSNDVMVILDNHLSKPGWCCSKTDGNGFFGDQYFDPNLWIKGLTKMATLFNNTGKVIGMSLRNELRGPRQNTADWYKYMTRGAEAVHAANPNVLVILSGLSFDNDLAFLHGQQVKLTFTKKLVFEVHWYGFSDGSAWKDGNPNQVCGRVVGNVLQKAGFLLDRGYPLFLSEFGADQRGSNVNDNRYISCALGVIADLDLDWALWTLQGSYYLRQGTLELDEVYGVLGWDWCKTRNSTYLQRIAAVQGPFRGPGVSETAPYKILFHPATGLCVLRNLQQSEQPLALGPCHESEAWNYTSQQRITLQVQETTVCLQAEGVGNPVTLDDSCDQPNSKWNRISDSRMHLSTSLLGDANATVCLDVGADGILVTNPCKCLTGDKTCEAESQWFKIVTSTRKPANQESLIMLPSKGAAISEGVYQQAS